MDEQALDEALMSGNKQPVKRPGAARRDGRSAGSGYDDADGDDLYGSMAPVGHDDEDEDSGEEDEKGEEDEEGEEDSGGQVCGWPLAAGGQRLAAGGWLRAIDN